MQGAGACCRLSVVLRFFFFSTLPWLLDHWGPLGATGSHCHPIAGIRCSSHQFLGAPGAHAGPVFASPPHIRSSVSRPPPLLLDFQTSNCNPSIPSHPAHPQNPILDLLDSFSSFPSSSPLPVHCLNSLFIISFPPHPFSLSPLIHTTYSYYILCLALPAFPPFVFIHLEIAGS